MFIDSLGTDDNSTTIVDTMVELADNLGMGIIAEGVETMEQIERLRELGVSAAQGYIFAPPLPAKLFIDLAQALSGGRGESQGESDVIAADARVA
jgi:sensor c-di-GMP phosphodiesterase-like protein